MEVSIWWVVAAVIVPTILIVIVIRLLVGSDKTQARIIRKLSGSNKQLRAENRNLANANYGLQDTVLDFYDNPLWNRIDELTHDNKIFGAENYNLQRDIKTLMDENLGYAKANNRKNLRIEKLEQENQILIISLDNYKEFYKGSNDVTEALQNIEADKQDHADYVRESIEDKIREESL